jgi:hypothetical protein
MDTSAVCKRYFVNEIGADVVDDLFNDNASTRHLINLAIPETLNAFYRLHREGHLTDAERDVFIASFYDDITNGNLQVYSVRDDHILKVEPISRALQAMRVTKKRPGPVDALLVVCALDFDLTDLILVNSDVDLNTLAQQFGITTLDPQNP